MKLKVVLTPEAQDDLYELFDYIDEHDGPDRALNYIERIEKACMSLQTLPNRGTRAKIFGRACECWVLSDGL